MKHADFVVRSTAIALSVVVGCLVAPGVVSAASKIAANVCKNVSERLGRGIRDHSGLLAGDGCCPPMPAQSAKRKVPCKRNQ